MYFVRNSGQLIVGHGNANVADPQNPLKSGLFGEAEFNLDLL